MGIRGGLGKSVAFGPYFDEEIPWVHVEVLRKSLLGRVQEERLRSQKMGRLRSLVSSAEM